MNLKKDGKPKPQQVEPVKNTKDIKKIRQYLLGLKDKRNYCLWVCGTNLLLRATDLLRLKWIDLMEDENNLKPHLIIGEQKTNKATRIKVNEDVKQAIKLYKDSLEDWNINDYIFVSSKVKKKPITVGSLHKIIKTLCKELNIKGNYGSHTLRKTGAYKIYSDNIKDNPAILAYLQQILNHSSQKITLAYIGITAMEIDDIYDKIKWD